MPGQIVIVNGTSGSGKSTAADLFAKRAEDFWLVYGIDWFTSRTIPSKFGHHGERSREGYFADPVDEDDPGGKLRWRFAPNAMRAFGVMHEWLAAASRGGCNIIVDHLLFQDPPLLQDCVRRLEGLPILLVTLKPPFAVLQQRIAERKPSARLDPEAVRRIYDRLDRLRPWFYDAVYANEVSDLAIDTSLNTPEQVCALIEDRLAQGPGTAFDELRRGWA